MSELFIPRQGRNLPPRPVLGRPRLCPEVGAHAVVVAPAGVAVIDARVAARLDDLVTETAPRPAGPRRGGPRHGRRVVGGATVPVLAGAAGLLVGVFLGAAAWAGVSGPDRPAPGTPRIAVAAAR